MQGEDGGALHGELSVRPDPLFPNGEPIRLREMRQGGGGGGGWGANGGVWGGTTLGSSNPIQEDHCPPGSLLPPGGSMIPPGLSA